MTVFRPRVVGTLEQHGQAERTLEQHGEGISSCSQGHRVPCRPSKAMPRHAMHFGSLVLEPTFDHRPRYLTEEKAKRSNSLCCLAFLPHNALPCHAMRCIAMPKSTNATIVVSIIAVAINSVARHYRHLRNTHRHHLFCAHHDGRLHRRRDVVRRYRRHESSWVCSG